MMKMHCFRPALISVFTLCSACGLGGKIVPDSAAGLPTHIAPIPSATPQVVADAGAAPITGGAVSVAPIAAAPATAAPAPTAAPAGATPDLLDQTTAAQRASALTAGTGQGPELGQVVVSLGSPTEQGLWLKTSLVSVPQKGRVVTDQGAALILELIPATGAAQMSLAAYRTLGLPLTGLPTLMVYGE